MIEYISVKGMYKSYRDKLVVRDMSFSVRPGEIFSLLGADGAGKSTTIECIGGLRRPDSGEITVYWMDVTKSPHKVQKEVGILLENAALPDLLTVKEAMMLYCGWHNVEYRDVLLERFDMGKSYLDMAYASLTEARKRRLHLALALCHDPKILILDEPSARLDDDGRRILHYELKRLKEDGICILMTTNDITEAESISDNIAYIKNGEIARIGKPKELTAKKILKSKVIIKTLDGCLKNERPLNVETPEVLEDGYLSFACVDIAEQLMSILSHIRKCGDSIIDIKIEHARDEDEFLSVAGGGKR